VLYTADLSVVLDIITATYADSYSGGSKRPYRSILAFTRKLFYIQKWLKNGESESIGQNLYR